MSEFETWQLLLIPCFFGLGWLAARIDMRQVVQESRVLPRSYFQGLNFLLNEQPDKAIDAFLEVARGDQQTVELHFALGGLFRRRGETERAIRMHQSLLDREDVTDETRLQALFELGQDYLKAGLLDRSEEIFMRLVETSLKGEAQRALLEIFQLEKEWQKAIEIAKQLPDLASRRELAQFHCELAANALMRSNFIEAHRYLDEALGINRKCVRATLLLGDTLILEGQPEQALLVWQRIEQQDPAYLALVAQRLLDAYRSQSKQTEGMTLLRAYLERYPSLDILEVLYQLVQENEGLESAYHLVRAELQRNPTLLGVDKMLTARMPLVPAETRTDVELLRTVVQGYTRRLARYRCEACGFKARQHYWRCPACGGWECYPPRRSEEFDSTL